VTATASWLVQWQQADRVARAAATAAIESEPRFLTPHIARALWSGLPTGAVLYVANSMAIREIDLFAGPRKPALRVLANRGVNGIDGQVSAALGAAAALRRPTVLWCGDLALLHDVSGLLAGRMHGGDLTIVVSNDDGGGIFEYLTAARLVSRPVFEELFAVPHGLDLHELARGVGWDAIRVDSGASFEQALARALDGGRHVIEVTIDRAVNTAFHAAIHQRVREQLQRDLRG
jgi:2-succinyl-5-enolpyruvyl-6-hydroxy-3-cyclohexene-1-carboxylate synthase